MSLSPPQVVPNSNLMISRKQFGNHLSKFVSQAIEIISFRHQAKNIWTLSNPDLSLLIPKRLNFVMTSHAQQPINLVFIIAIDEDAIAILINLSTSNRAIAMPLQTQLTSESQDHEKPKQYQI